MKYPQFLLEEYLAKREFSAPHNFCASDLESISMSDLLSLADDEGKALWHSLRLNYTEPLGLPELRAEIAKGYAKAIGAENILCFAGAEEGIYSAVEALFSSDDHAVVVTPCYQSLHSLPNTIGNTTAVTITHEEGWRLDLNKVREAIQPNSKMLLVNFPHNPTGSLITPEEQKELVEIAREHDLWLFSDEVYRHLELDPADRLPPFADLYEKALSLAVMSKAYGLPGLRIGWIACQNEEALAAIGEVKHYLSICNSAPSEVLAFIALRAGEKILERNRTLMQGNLHLLDSFFTEYEEWFEWVRPKGGCIGYPRFKGSLPIAELADQLMEETGVLILPAAVYEDPGNHFRISFGRSTMPDVLIRFIGFIEKHKNEWSKSDEASSAS